MHETLRWMRDWALFGGITCAVAPSVGSHGQFPLVPPGFCTAAAALGTVSGAAVGLLIWTVMCQIHEPRRVAVAAVVWPVVLGGWGACVAGTAAAMVEPDMGELAVICGAVAATLQTAWFAPAYTRQAVRGARRWPLLGIATGTGVLVGAAAVQAAFGVIDHW